MYPPSSEFKALRREVTDVDRKWFVDQLSESDRFKGLCWYLSPEPDPLQLPAPSVESIMLMDGYSAASDSVAFICQHIELSQVQTTAIEEVTRGQRDNPLWSLYRKGRLTASTIGLVIKAIASKRRPCKSLMKTLLGAYNLEGVKAVQWGITHESTAISTYEEATGQTVSPSGLWLHSSGILGGSPDGIVNSTTIIEVKCPFSAKTTSLYDMVDTPKGYFLQRTSRDSAELDLNLQNDQGRKYFHQVQCNLFLTGRTVCDFIVWTPSTMIIFPVVRNPTWTENVGALVTFYQTHFLPTFQKGGVE